MPVITQDKAPEDIAWSIGGSPVVFDWDSARMTAPGGYERVSGTVTGGLQRRHIKQGARIVGTRPNGKILYQGLVISPPKVVSGVAYVEAEGHQGIVRRRNTRLPYIIADASQWSAEDELPFDYAQHEKYTLQSKNDSIGWIIDKDESYTASDRAGYAIYVPDHAPQRLKCTMRKRGGSNANFELEVRGADELGTLTVVTAVDLGAGHPDGQIVNTGIAGDKNTIVLSLNCNTNAVPTNTIKLLLQDVVLCVIADNNDWTTSQVVSDVAGRVNFADDVEATSTQIESLDWNGGWDELLDYMAAIEDFTWLVTEDTTKGPAADAQLTFRPWGHKEWRTTLNLCQENLTVAPLYNKVTVNYERPAGVPQHKSFEPADFDLEDPIPGLTYEYPDPPILENPQRSKAMVNAIGERTLRRVLETRLVGNVKVAGLLKGRPFDIKAGDTLAIQDYDPKCGPQRIASVTYNRDGTADCTLERSFDVAAMLFRLGAHRKRSTPHKWGSGHRS